jgi:hypothetical protein
MTTSLVDRLTSKGMFLSLSMSLIASGNSVDGRAHSLTREVMYFSSTICSFARQAHLSATTRISSFFLHWREFLIQSVLGKFLLLLKF